ncbi:zinc finger CCHC domain-containing protein 4 [Anoplophora glabripennis]|uniref:zinc finger CCHC domain-containing protein 4 n=1 Tax=Anoplophora glabripennis TaxID=217634 RepID=UPI0008752B7D|nr:zinc finger CCHC domain-containing protein 4 [Anoplophora glabripennis]
MTKGNIEIIVKDLKDHPQCIHGPTILFSREVKGVRRNFFACSACRERKHCNFFLWEDERNKLTLSKKQIWEQETMKYLKNINHRKIFVTLNKVIGLPPTKRLYCHNCSEFVLEMSESKHSDHNLLRGLTDYQLNHPSEILLPAENTKKEAQYLFSKLSVKTIVDIFTQLGYKDVICIGTPRIHEHIRSSCDDMNSILLDIDSRFHSFFGPLEYVWYNSFNHHFFFTEAGNVFKDFLKSSKGKNTVLITDPPFGGRVEPLAFTFTTINNEYKSIHKTKSDLPMFWVFPYFMEPQILNSLPNFKMLDYKVLYDNHSSFQNGPKGRKQGSPVRIFTNVNPRLIKLPEDEYKFCPLCNRWVSLENKHCSLCNNCTSKDGRSYVHCEICKRCVKPTWKHCRKCERCTQVEHKCLILKFSKRCFHCKEEGHKKSECPLMNIALNNRRKKKIDKRMKKKKIHVE